jgi:glycosyltransferase involved in cell wall biosynthesis
MSARPEHDRGHVLIIVQNLPVPLDRRVWLECQTLNAAGYRVSVICPKGPGDPGRQVLDGVLLLKYRPAPEARGALGFLFECVYAWLQTARLARQLWREDPFHAMQACNPPDTFFALARRYQGRGVRFVFDHHDLCPEIFRARFGRDDGLALWVLLALERATFATADQVISTNESYRAVAVHRGRVDRQNTTVVRSGPDPSVMQRGPEAPELRHQRAHLACYLGVMGHQDGVDLAIRAAAALVHDGGRRDIHFAFLGFGDCLEDLKALTHELDLDDYVTFTGRAELPEIRRYLSTADIGLSPDPRNAFNDASTMNKTLEYMAFELPVVAFDLVETRVSAGPAAVYVEPTDPAAFAQAVAELLDDPERRAVMGREGRRRIEDGLGWPHQAEAYRGVYDALLGAAQPEASVLAEVPTTRLADDAPSVRSVAVATSAAVDG